jgi:hypothetical protein
VFDAEFQDFFVILNSEFLWRAPLQQREPAKIDQVTLVPDEAELAIELRGDLAAILRFAANKKNPDVLSEVGVLGTLLSQE